MQGDSTILAPPRPRPVPHNLSPAVVWFRVDGDPALHFAARRADGRYWAANRYRGWRLQGVTCKRLRPILVAGENRIAVRLVPGPVELVA